MILVDTSVWVDHFRVRIEQLGSLIEAEQVFGHPYVTGELAVGDLRDWHAAVSALRALPQAKIASEQSFLDLLAGHNLVASGLGFVDVHLLASCRLGDTMLWTHDKRLERCAEGLGLSWSN